MRNPIIAEAELDEEDEKSFDEDTGKTRGISRHKDKDMVDSSEEDEDDDDDEEEAAKVCYSLIIYCTIEWLTAFHCVDSGGFHC